MPSRGDVGECLLPLISGEVSNSKRLQFFQNFPAMEPQLQCFNKAPEYVRKPFAHVG